MMKTSFTEKVRRKWKGIFVLLLFLTTTMSSTYAAECGFDCSDLTMTINCEGELIVELYGYHGYHVSFFADHDPTGDLLEVDYFELGVPIIHAVQRFESGGDFRLQIENIYDPKCFQIIDGILPTWDIPAGIGSGVYYFNDNGGICEAVFDFNPFDADGPSIDIVEVIKPTCPMGNDGIVKVMINGAIMPVKCQDSDFSVRITNVNTLEGTTKMASVGQMITFDEVTAGDFEVSIVDVTYSCPCMFGTPDPKEVTVKEPSSNTTSLACHNQTNVSADENCKVTINYWDIAIGENNPCMMVSMMDDSIFIYGPHGILIGSGSPAALNGGNVTFDAHEYVGEHLKVEIHDGESPNWCWGYVVVEDKLPPKITCNDPSLTEIPCLDFDGTFTTNLIVHDCDPYAEVTIIEEKRITDCEKTQNYLKKIELTYFATDRHGNKSDVCTDELKVRRFLDPIDANNYVFKIPDDFVHNPIACDDYHFPLDQYGNPAPTAAGTGFPVVDYVKADGSPGWANLFPINYETDDPHYLAQVDRLISYCKVAVTYDDFVINVGCKTKIQRTWTLREWSCYGETVVILGMQEIHIADDEAPYFVEKVQDQDVSINSYSCSKYKEIKAPVLVDNCAADEDIYYQVIIYDEDWNKIGPDQDYDGYFDFPLGKNYVEYTAFDKCHNSRKDTAVVNVLDKTPPVVICKEFLVVGISVDGTVRVPASAFDNGSYDDCYLYETCVVRMDDQEAFDALDTDGDWWVLFEDFEAACGRDFYHYAVEYQEGKQGYGYYLHRNALCTPEVYFCCADDDPEEDNDEVQVIFRATDSYHNSNECMVVVEIQDKRVPDLICPPNVKVDCEIPLPGIEDVSEDFVPVSEDPLAALFGSVVGEHEQQPFGFHDEHLLDDFGEVLKDGVFFDNCEDPTIYVKTEVNIDQCHQGYIYRTFYAEDGSGNRSKECTQTIYIAQRYPLSYDRIYWPEDDLNIIGCLDPNDTKSITSDEPYIEKGECTLIGVNWEDQVFTFNTTDPEADQACFKILRTWRVIDWCRSDHSGQPYIYEHVQILKVKDLEGPTLINPDDPDDDGWEVDGVCRGIDEPFIADNCYEGHVVLRNSATDECTDDNDLLWTVKVVQNKGSFDETVVYPYYSISGSVYEIDDYFPVGTHEVVWTVEDLCGNRITCKQEFSVVYNKKPTPFAIDLTTVLMNTNSLVTLWATDLNNKSNHECYHPEDLEFSIVRAGGGIDQSSSSITFGCADVGSEGVDIDFYVRVKDTDLYDYTTVNVRIQDNIGVCDGIVFGQTSSIQGNISTHRSDRVRDMEVDLGTENQGASTSLSQVMTDEKGNYSFPEMPMGGSYDIRPVSSTDYLNGVSTFDLVIIQQFILGMTDLESDYDHIASDVNNDEVISAGDIVELRSLILGINQEYTNNTSWRFVDKSFEFLADENPLKAGFNESYRIGELSSDMLIDFVGVKIGDVNGSVAVENVLAGSRSRYDMISEDQSFVSGEEVSVPVKAGSQIDLIGFQLTAQFDNDLLEFVGVESAALALDGSHVGARFANRGQVAMSWDEAAGAMVESGTALFTMKFVAKRSGKLSEALDINSELVNAEIYSSSYDISNISLEYEEARILGDGFKLMQNRPNPFASSTEISFQLPQAGTASLTFFDVTGKVVKVINGEFAKGMNTIQVSKDDLSASGVIYYSLETDEYTDTKRMVVLK